MTDREVGGDDDNKELSIINLTRLQANKIKTETISQPLTLTVRKAVVLMV